MVSEWKSWESKECLGLTVIEVNISPDVSG